MHYYNSITIKQAPLYLLLSIAEDLLTHTKCSNGVRLSVPKCHFGTFGCQLLRLKIVQFEPTPIGSVHPCFTRAKIPLNTTCVPFSSASLLPMIRVRVLKARYVKIQTCRKYYADQMVCCLPHRRRPPPPPLPHHYPD